MTPQEEKLPFDIRTLLIGIWLRKLILLIGFLISVALGLIVVKYFGARQYTSETVLVYQPIMKEEDSDTSQALNTFMHLVKIQSNLEETRKRLKLRVSTAELGASVSVFLKKNTDLMVIRVTWNSALETARIANTLRDVFMENNRKMRSGKWYLSELASVDALYQDTLLKKKALDKQEANLDRIINDLKERIRKEKVASKEMEGLGNLNIRVSQLRAAIEEDKNFRANQAEMARKEAELKRAEKLLSKKIISRSEFDLVKADYERQKALTEDTDQTRKWKAELERLNQSILPSGSGSAPSAPLLSEMMLKVFEVQLEKVAVTEKLSILEKSRSRLTAQLRLSREKQRTAGQDVDNEAEIDWENLSAEKRLAILAQSTGFSIVSNATAPVYPQKSNRKLLFVAVAFLGSFFTVTLVVALELFDSSIKSEAELKLKFDNPVFGHIPLIESQKSMMPGLKQMDIPEHFRLIARKIRSDLKERGIRIMVTAVNQKAGSTYVTANLAACLGRIDERVLLLDGQLRKTGKMSPYLGIMHLEDDLPGGLGEYLSYETDSPEKIIHPTVLPGVMCIPKIGEAVIPDLAGSNRMKELLEHVTKSYSIVLIDAPPLLSSADAELMAEMVDAVILVVESKQTRLGQIRKSLERLESQVHQSVGFILNKVNKYYIEKS